MINSTDTFCMTNACGKDSEKPCYNRILIDLQVEMKRM